MWQFTHNVHQFRARFHLVDNADNPTLETYRALPAAEHPYSNYDMSVIAEILTLAEHQAQEAYRKGKGALSMPFIQHT